MHYDRHVNTRLLAGLVTAQSSWHPAHGRSVRLNYKRLTVTITMLTPAVLMAIARTWDQRDMNTEANDSL